MYDCCFLIDEYAEPPTATKQPAGNVAFLTVSEGKEVNLATVLQLAKVNSL